MIAGPGFPAVDGSGGDASRASGIDPAPTAPAIATPSGLTRVAFRAMGTDVEVLLPAGREAAAASVVAVFVDWERRCSRFDESSELSRLNARAGAPTVVSASLYDVVAVAMAAARATDGVFDPTILRRLEDLGYDRTFDAITPGAAPAVRTATPAWASAWHRVRLDRATHTVDLPAGIGLDLGGIAKGMAVDVAIATLAADGLTTAAVNAGGDLAVLGTPPGQDAWWVAVETPGGGVPVALASGALATSATTRRRWSRGGLPAHHLIDPRTGMPAASGLASVTAAAASCAQAEVAAKTALILGPRDAVAFLDRVGVSALAVGDDGTLYRHGRWLDAGRPAPGGSVPA